MEDIFKSFSLGPTVNDLNEPLEKAAHKYIKRTGIAGNYKYWYKLPNGHVVSSDNADGPPHVDHEKKLDTDERHASQEAPTAGGGSGGGNDDGNGKNEETVEQRKERIQGGFKEKAKLKQDATYPKDDAKESDKSAKHKEKIITSLINSGNNPDASKKMVNDHYDYISRVYPDASTKEKAQIIRTLGPINGKTPSPDAKVEDKKESPKNKDSHKIDDVLSAVHAVFPKKSSLDSNTIKTLYKLVGNGKDEQIKWNDVNSALVKLHWSDKHIADVASHLAKQDVKKSQGDNMEDIFKSFRLGPTVLEHDAEVTFEKSLDEKVQLHFDQKAEQIAKSTAIEVGEEKEIDAILKSEDSRIVDKTKNDVISMLHLEHQFKDKSDTMF